MKTAVDEVARCGRHCQTREIGRAAQELLQIAAIQCFENVANDSKYVIKTAGRPNAAVSGASFKIHYLGHITYRIKEN